MWMKHARRRELRRALAKLVPGGVYKRLEQDGPPYNERIAEIEDKVTDALRPFCAANGIDADDFGWMLFHSLGIDLLMNEREETEIAECAFVVSVHPDSVTCDPPSLPKPRAEVVAALEQHGRGIMFGPESSSRWPVFHPTSLLTAKFDHEKYGERAYFAENATFTASGNGVLEDIFPNTTWEASPPRRARRARRAGRK